MTDRGYDFGWKKIDRIFKKTKGKFSFLSMQQITDFILNVRIYSHEKADRS